MKEAHAGVDGLNGASEIGFGEFHEMSGPTNPARSSDQHAAMPGKVAA